MAVCISSSRFGNKKTSLSDKFSAFYSCVRVFCYPSFSPSYIIFNGRRRHTKKGPKNVKPKKEEPPPMSKKRCAEVVRKEEEDKKKGTKNWDTIVKKREKKVYDLLGQKRHIPEERNRL